MSDTDQTAGVDRDTLARVIRSVMGVALRSDSRKPYDAADAVLAHLNAHTPPAPTTSPDLLREAAPSLAQAWHQGYVRGTIAQHKIETGIDPWPEGDAVNPYGEAERPWITEPAAPDPRPDQDGLPDVDSIESWWQCSACNVVLRNGEGVLAAMSGICPRCGVSDDDHAPAPDAAEDQR